MSKTAAEAAQTPADHQYHASGFKARSSCRVLCRDKLDDMVPPYRQSHGTATGPPEWLRALASRMA